MRGFNNSLITYTLSGLIALSIGIYFRLYPLIFHTSNEASEKATLIVLANLRKVVNEQVQANYPELSGAQKLSLAKKNFDELLHHQGQKVRDTIERASLSMDKQLGSEVPYLLESDSFDYYNLTENILKTGKISDKVKGSKYFNKLMMAPLGYYEPLNLLPYVGAGVYRVVSLFNPGISLMYAVGFSSLLITVFCLIFFMLLCYHLRCHWAVSLTGAVFFLLAPIFIKRSCFGWYDNDPYNILFPLLLMLCFFKGTDFQIEFKKRAVFMGGDIAGMVLYAFFWQGWVYFFSLLLITLAGLIVFNRFIEADRKKSKSAFFLLIGIVVATFAGIAMTFGFEDFFVLFQEGWKALKEFLAPGLSLWPDMYVSVGELRKATFGEILEFTGGIFFVAVSIAGFIAACLQAWREHKTRAITPVLILGLFFISSFILTLGAQRFALLLVVPMSIFFTLGLQSAYTFLNAWGQRKFPIFKHEPWRLNLGLSVILLALTIFPIINAKDTTLDLLNRIYNKTWDEVLTKIKSETPANSIVNTWWPPGHFIKAMANRAVTFDGATINKPQAYWMANVFLTGNEDESLGILRMLNTSANEATDYLQSLGLDLARAIDILRAIIPLSKKEAASFLQKSKLTPDQADRLLQLTHAAPPPSYLLIYNELVEKNLVLSFVDRWNFKKIEEISHDPQARALIPAKKSPQYIKFLWDVAGGPLNYSDALGQLFQSDHRLLFDEGLQVDMDRMAARIDSPHYGHGTPKGIVYLKDGVVEYKRLPDARLPFWVVLSEDGNRYSAMLMDERLAFSVLTRLYFFEGKGSKYFSLFTHAADLTKRTNIYVYKVNWEEFWKD